MKMWMLEQINEEKKEDESGTQVSWFRYMLQDQAGIGVVEVILILVVLIGLVIIFKSQLTALVASIFETIVDESSGI